MSGVNIKDLNELTSDMQILSTIWNKLSDNMKELISHSIAGEEGSSKIETNLNMMTNIINAYTEK